MHARGSLLGVGGIHKLEDFRRSASTRSRVFLDIASFPSCRTPHLMAENWFTMSLFYNSPQLRVCPLVMEGYGALDPNRHNAKHSAIGLGQAIPVGQFTTPRSCRRPTPAQPCGSPMKQWQDAIFAKTERVRAHISQRTAGQRARKAQATDEAQAVQADNASEAFFLL